MAIQVQILDKAVCISHSVNTLGKNMNPIILPPAISKQYSKLGFLILVWRPVKVSWGKYGKN